MVRKILNIVAFEAGWFACAFSTAKGFPILGITVIALLAALHLALSPSRNGEAKLLMLVGGIGILADSTLIAFGAFRLDPNIVPPLMIPLWSFAFHLNFATTLRTSLSWLGHLRLRSAILGGVGGSLAFEAGRRLHAIEFSDSSWTSLSLIALAWAILTPTYFALSIYMNPSKRSASTSSIL